MCAPAGLERPEGVLYWAPSFLAWASNLARVLGGPPVAQLAVAVGLAALVVEAVGDLVADHAADAAVVDGRVAVRIEERRLQDRGREDDLVLGRLSSRR